MPEYSLLSDASGKGSSKNRKNIRKNILSNDSAGFWEQLSTMNLRKLVIKFVRFVLLVVLMVTVIINVLFIIDTHGRLQSSKFVGTKSPTRTVKMEILSSRERVQAVIDGTVIMDDSDPDRNRGIHVLVLNQASGSVMARRHFDTYSPGEDESMSLFLSMVSPGRIVIFAIKDEGTFQLKKPAKDILTKLGSKYAATLSWRDMWAMVVVKSSSSASLPSVLYGETIQKSPDPQLWAAPAILNFTLTLAENDDSACQWSSSANSLDSKNPASGSEVDHEVLVQEFLKIHPHRRQLPVQDNSPTDLTLPSLFLPDDPETAERRRIFCSRIEGYGSVCSCQNPLSLKFGVTFDPRAPISRVPIAVIASNRPHYLYRTLRTLLSTPGCNPSMITVFIDGYYEEPLEVARLFGLRGVQHTPIGTKNARISQHYKASLTALFSIYPDARYAIVLEEDLDVSADFFQYFADTMPILERDDSVFSISAWNDLAYENTAANASLLYRVEVMPGLGWMLSRRLFKEELEPKWPTPDKPWDWDMWMRLPEVQKNRESIVPDVPRTFHFGASGMNMNSYFQETYFKKHAVNTNPQARIKNLDSVLHDNYEHLVTRLIQHSKVIDLNKRSSSATSGPVICEPNSIRQRMRKHEAQAYHRGPKGPKNAQTSNQPLSFVLYIQMSHLRDYDSWLGLAKCLKIWDLDPRGYHKGVWRMHLDGSPLIVVGTPYSPFAVFKPAHVQPVVFSRNTTITKKP